MKQDKEEFYIVCMDFFGELLKFNKRVFTLFEISAGDYNLKKLEIGIKENYINSNLFIRAVTLSIIKFCQEGDQEFVDKSIIC